MLVNIWLQIYSTTKTTTTDGVHTVSASVISSSHSLYQEESIIIIIIIYSMWAECDDYKNFKDPVLCGLLLRD